MPTKIIKYACNYCGYEYKTEIGALNCEKIPVGEQPLIGALGVTVCREPFEYEIIDIELTKP